MELDIKELDRNNTMNQYDTFNHKSYEEDNSINYWNPQIKPENKERKKVSFNDILSNMNLVVNKEGVLQFMVPNKQNIHEEPNYNSNEFSQPRHYQPNNFLPQQINKSPLDQSVKHSYIYNKYFKDYVDPNAQKPGPRVPKTIQEYRKMILEDRIKAIQHKKRIDQIKSTKLMFTSAPGSVSNPRNIKATKNSLGTMNFR